MHEIQEKNESMKDMKCRKRMAALLLKHAIFFSIIKAVKKDASDNGLQGSIRVKQSENGGAMLWNIRSS